MKDKKNLIIIALSIGVLILLYIAFSPSPSPYDSTLIEQKVRELQRENDSLALVNVVMEEKQNKATQKIDSLEGLKPKIIIKYVQTFKEIDSYSTAHVISKFDSIFADNGVK